jgi:uncharacterized membrane protein YuzA (DUF378 family)
MINRIDYLFIGLFSITLFLNFAPLIRAKLEANFISNKSNEVLLGLAPLLLWFTYDSATSDTVQGHIIFGLCGVMFIYIYAVSYSALKNRVNAYNKALKQD